jgi:S-adenosylmethionine-diacylglycerol 3-amino-3-carboxypropyl transferase
MTHAAGGTVRERAAWDLVRYASVWEDADVLCEALSPLARGARLLSIASAGDNVLALLTLEPAEVVAADLSGAQLACLELRIAAFRRLDPAGIAAFLGATPSVDRTRTYALLRGELGAEARGYWDLHSGAIARGIVHEGKFERYFQTFRRWVLPAIHSRALVKALREPRDIEAQRAFYRDRWDTWRWRTLFRVFFSRFVMGRLGRDPAFFSHVDGAVGARILERSRHALSEIPTHSNPYLTYIVTGNFAPEALPRYLRPEHHATIRAGLDRIRLVKDGIASAATGRFAGFNLSDVFEYMDRTEHERTYERLLGAAAPGARLVYWNMLVPRGVPTALAGRVESLEALAAALHARDRAWFYSRLHVDEVRA